MNAQGTGQRIVVVGGYGAVGRVVSLALADRHHGTVVVAGRDVVRARTLARRSPGPLAPTEVDAADAAGLARVLDGAGVLVMCADGANLDVARCCLERGVHYVDISASARVLGAIEALDPLARAHGAAAALSVGLAPGVTNLLARSCVDLRPVTGLVFAARAAGLLRPLRHPPVQDRNPGRPPPPEHRQRPVRRDRLGAKPRWGAGDTGGLRTRSEPGDRVGRGPGRTAAGHRAGPAGCAPPRPAGPARGVPRAVRRGSTRTAVVNRRSQLRVQEARRSPPRVRNLGESRT